MKTDWKTPPNAPIAIFAYNRPDHLAQLIQSLATNPEFHSSQYYIFSDGAKHEQDANKVNQVRTLIKKTFIDNAEIIEAPKNQGLANSLITGITYVLSKHDRVIVLEDDLILSPTTLKFLNESLEFYLKSPSVMHISAHMFPIESKIESPFFYRGGTCWGWATWARAWKHFEPNANLLREKILTQKLQKEFDINGNYYFFKMLSDQAEGKLNSWAIRWYASIFLAGGLSLHPPVSLTQNIGFDGSGTHCGDSDFFKVSTNPYIVKDFPTEIIEDKKILNEIGTFLSRGNVPKVTFIESVLNMIKTGGRAALNQITKRD